MLPRLTFYCELDSDLLNELFQGDQVIQDLVALKAGVSLGLLDFSLQRAEIVRRLNQAGVPVTAWLLLPKVQGYWFNLSNPDQSVERYTEFCQWTAEQGLVWERVGLDIEPNYNDIERILAKRRRILPMLFRRLFEFNRLPRARRIYRELVDRIHADGYVVETYQIPFILDERQVRSTLLQRATGILDLRADREVLMLYTSFFPKWGAGLLWSYAHEAQYIALGSTGGGIELPGFESPAMSWRDFSRDLRLVWHLKDEIYIFSLEGCVRQGFLDHLKSFEWDLPVIPPDDMAARMNGWRRGLQSVLWISHIGLVLVLLILALILLRRFIKQK